MNQYTNINSQLEALKLKDIETYFYEKIGNNASIIPKVTPFKGINTDMLYIKDNKFYINNNEHLELIAHYYYQALKDGMSSEEFDEWAFIASYRHMMRLLDPTNTDMTK